MEGILRCWKCRRFVLDVGSLSLSSGGESSKIQNAAEESAGQIDCTVWHVNLDAIPVWIRKEIEKSWWTIGKLNCQHCGARLGDFNFVCPAKCPCGQTLTAHLCKSRTDYEPPRLIRISEPAEVKSLQKLQYTHMLETVEKMEHGTENSLFRYRQKDFLHHSRKMDREKMTDALCLEARSHSRGIVEVDSKEFNFKAACSQPCSSASQPVRDRCPVKGFHRKTLSLDFNRKDSKDASVSFASIHGLGPRSSSCGLVKNHPDETASPMQQIQLAEDSNLQPPAREESNGSLFPGQFIKKSDFLLSPQSLHHHPVEEECEDVDPGPSVPSHCRRNAAHISSIVRGWSPDSSTEASDVEEWDEGHEAGASNPWDDSTLCVPLFSTVVDRPLNKRQRNKLKSLKRKQRKWQRWHQSKLNEQNQASSSNLTTSDDDEIKWEKEGYICAVCLDIFFSPYMCYPCHHIFCEPCLRTLAKDNPTSTPCPLCRTIITRVFFQSDLNNTMKSLFSEEYLARRQSFQKASCAKWPLPSCRRLIKVLGGFGRRPDPVARRQFPHGAYRLDFEDDNRGWRFDMDMVIIYIYSVNWVIGFIIFCFLCYFFFPSF